MADETVRMVLMTRRSLEWSDGDGRVWDEMLTGLDVIARAWLSDAVGGNP